ncbi:MAG TPA: glycosyltransferase family 39 protein [Coriobacteriia bacterium]|nr:glycosyltransferase family 39 protein [Coriobacteriia bacterium]
MSSSVKAALLPKMDMRRWTGLGAMLLVALILRGARLSEPPGGFHVFNEGFYIDLARRMAQQPFFGWLTHPLDVNNPPLFPLFVSLLYRLGAPLVAGARAVSVASGVVTVYATFLLGRLLYTDRVGTIAAALVAVMPGVVMVDHNIQVDPLFVALMVGSVLLYVVAARTGSNGSAIAAGVMLGLCLLTKQAAVVAVAALFMWETWSASGLRWLKNPRVWRFGVAFVAVGAPWFLVQAVTNKAGQMFANAASISQTSTAMGYGTTFWTTFLGGELLAMLFPAVALLAVIGLVMQARRHGPADKLVISMCVGYVAWYVVFHQHSYYLLPLGPVAALAAAHAFDALTSRVPKWPVAVSAALLVPVAFAAVVMLAGHKWGYFSPMSLHAPASSSGVTRLYVDPGATDFYGPTVDVVDSRYKVIRQGVGTYAAESAQTNDGSVILAGDVRRADGTPITPAEILSDTWYEPVAFGYAITATPMNLTWTSFFGGSRWAARRVGPPWRFGMQQSTVPCFYALYDRDCFR